MHKINYLKNLLADSDRATAALDMVKPISTNYLKNLLADSDRVTASLGWGETNQHQLSQKLTCGL